jgi:hypothetical protein
MPLRPHIGWSGGGGLISSLGSSLDLLRPLGDVTIGSSFDFLLFIEDLVEMDNSGGGRSSNPSPA